MGYKVVYDPLHVACSGSGTTPECSAKDCCELVSAPTPAPFAATTTKPPTTTRRATITTSTTTTITTTGEESPISVSMTLNIDYQQLGADDKVEIKKKIRDVLAASASVDQATVSVTLTPGSVKVDARIQTPDANSAKSIEKSMNTDNIAKNVVEAANSIPGVKAAATGELRVTGLEVKTATRIAKGSVPLTTAMPQTETGAPASTTSFRSVVSTTALEGDAALSDSASGSSYLGIAEAWCILVATAVINWFNW